MNISYNWLKEYIDIDLEPEVLAAKLTDAGLEAVIVETLPEFFKSIVVGHVVSKEKHPDADKLSVCMIDLGREEPKQIICGAPNIAAGQNVAVATIGTTFPDGMKIKKAKLRGVVSNGMVCSERELDLSQDHSGIMVLDEDAELGMDMVSYLSGNDVSIELDLTPDRSDALGHIGVARDLAALLGLEMRKPVFELNESSTPTSDIISVELEDTQSCPRYAARIVKNVKIGASPVWMRQRLQAIGIRSINNVVDAANYVLMETGHPLHTFDLRYIEGGKIVVRKAGDKEKITTLDGKERELDDSVLLICDAKKPVAVAGIMGGENSEVKDDTTDLLLESAFFDAVVVRRGAKKLQLATDASHRFERGTDPNGIPFALDRLASLIVELAGGEITQGQVDAYPQTIEPLEVSLRAQRCNAILGTEIETATISKILNGLELFHTEDGGVFQVTVPTFRPDITREIDLIEEVGRIFGYNSIPVPQHFSIANKINKKTPDQIRERIIDHLASIGFNQIYGNGLLAVDEHPSVFGDEEALILANPLSRDMASMRSSLLMGMAKVADYNINRRQSDLKLFELGNVSTVDMDSDTGACETSHLAIFISGELQSKQWSQESVEVDVFQMKGILSSTYRDLFGLDLLFEPMEHDLFTESIAIYLGEEKIGILGNLKMINQNLKSVRGVYTEVRNSENLGLSRNIQYQKVSVYPAVERDLSILIDAIVPFGKINETIQKNAGKSLVYSRLYDIYEGKSIASGKKSLTFRLVFQNKTRTLTEKEIDKDFRRILKGLEDAYNATLREAI
ncbi:MAG: phenylalanine--tRNA ligase subunit beta [Candidatus Marinimicrobia bacterium]|jgi:phenylalanyl-tRNA synthetase beta chain|nr:phenylalanine--tRNA ligase subunit beta [Candidatus Neomarinimicrobiota bacterium]MBT3575614.1 phenylalanine--tRNA ligase subunit beta [Candidatus Neomarinimicrobiota bacterium]MBT3680145.1 phenylalanine--tRNA ligase subunit beta [Candidatus Neomarinimicrobiota bacterium]MBT3950455.1 phenylalanine--tRNA ligase subunit beta [Candidatus Neomarinimicrobiota bacterium]MBT4251857.1 phenylalanine--tRNA ligase subunit beta [Candidatus Neomarinimicrobiota bacterium]